MPQNGRLRSLDVFRGLTIALMILVNSPGNQYGYAWLDHASWNGCTFADYVFPFFIFIVGLSTVFSLSKAHESGISDYELLPKILKRALLIFFIGLLLNAFPSHFDFTTLRVLGVLQRIAICYFFTAMLYLKTSVKTQCLVLTALLIGYWVIITQCSPAHYTAHNNFAAEMDRWLLTPDHLYTKTFDPEGVLSTLPAIATALLGNLTGIWLRAARTPLQLVKGLFAAGLILLGAGYLWGIWFPINKTLWTSSYVLWTGGAALLVFATCYRLIEIKGYVRWSVCFEIFGVNALVAYVLHVFFLKVQAMIYWTTSDGALVKLRPFITESCFGWTSLQNASLLYAISYTLLWLLVLTVLYRRKIFVKL